MNEKVLMTAGRGREKIPVNPKSAGSLSIHELEHGRLNLSDLDYCVKFGEPKQWTKWRKEVEAERAKLPAWSFWKCGKCGWKVRMAGDAGGGACLMCNLQNQYVDGGQLEKMSAAEIEKFLADEKAAEEKWIADAPKREAELAEFNKRIIQNLPRG